MKSFLLIDLLSLINEPITIALLFVSLKNYFALFIYPRSILALIRKIYLITSEYISYCMQKAKLSLDC